MQVLPLKYDLTAHCLTVDFNLKEKKKSVRSTTAEGLKLFSCAFALGGCSREISLGHVIQCSTAFLSSCGLGLEKVSSSSE